MFFKRSNGEFRETDRVTRFKLIKSGKNWLRAATSNFGLLKVIRGQVEETVVAEVREDAVSANRNDKPWLAQRDRSSRGCSWCSYSSEYC